MTERYKTISQISEMFEIDRRTIKKQICDLKIIKTFGKAEYYDMIEVGKKLNLNRSKSEEPDARAMFEAELSLEQAKAEKAQLELEKLKQEVIPIDEVSKLWAEIAITVKNKILGIASKIKQRHPEIGLDVYATIEANHREALEELANESETEINPSV